MVFYGKLFWDNLLIGIISNMNKNEVYVFFKNTLQILINEHKIDDSDCILRTGVLGNGNPPKYHFLVLTRKSDGNYIPSYTINCQIIGNNSNGSYFLCKELIPTSSAMYFRVNGGKSFWTTQRTYNEKEDTSLIDFMGGRDGFLLDHGIICGIRPQAIQALLNVNQNTPNYQVLTKNDPMNKVVFKVEDFLSVVKHQHMEITNSGAGNISAKNNMLGDQTFSCHFSESQLVKNSGDTAPVSSTKNIPSLTSNQSLNNFIQPHLLKQSMSSSTQAFSLSNDANSKNSSCTTSSDTYEALIQQCRVLERLLEQTKFQIQQHPQHKNQVLHGINFNIIHMPPPNILPNGLSFQTSSNTTSSALQLHPTCLSTSTQKSQIFNEAEENLDNLDDFWSFQEAEISETSPKDSNFNNNNANNNSSYKTSCNSHSQAFFFKKTQQPEMSFNHFNHVEGNKKRKLNDINTSTDLSITNSEFSKFSTKK